MRPTFNLMAGAGVMLALAFTAGVAAAQTTNQSPQVIRPPSASSHAAAPGSAADNASKNTPGGASTWQPKYVSADKNTPGGASTWQRPVGTMTKNTPGG